jgi:hypothetical protein
MLDFRDWLPKEKFEELIEKSKSDNLTQDERKALIEELCYFGCPQEEIATLLNTTRAALMQAHRVDMNRAEVRWRIDLRKAQAINAMTNRGNCTMLMWLGKQYLSQKEDPQLEVKKDKFDEFIEWMRTQASTASPTSNEITS